MKKTLVLLALLLSAPVRAEPPTPVFHAKVSLLEGLFAYDERCGYKISPSWENPVQFRMQFVREGEPLGYDVIFTFASTLLADGRVEVTVQRQVYNRGRLDRGAQRSEVVLLRRGREESVKLDTWYGEGWGKMQALFKVELRYDGETRPASGPRRDEAGHAIPRRMACGQVFL